MLRHLILASAAFHAMNVFALFLFFRRLRFRHHEDPAIRARPVRLALNIALLGLGAAGAALAVGLQAGLGGFGVINLLSQWLFGEFPVLLGLSAYFLRRAGARLPGALFGLAVFAVAAIFVDAHYVEPSAIDVNEHVVALDGDRELRIAHLSDIQTPAIGDHERLAFRKALASKPDLILLTGDYIHALPGAEDVEGARRDFRALLNSLPWPRLGIYAVKGDTEGDAWPSMFEGTRVVTLTNEAVRLPIPGGSSRHLSLLGLSPDLARGRSERSLRGLVRSFPESDLRIIFGHSPDYVMGLEQDSVDMAFGGHTHGGQIALPFFGPPLTLSRLPRHMARGLHEWNGTAFHVSAGVGMERRYAPQLRFLCRPEVCLVRVPY